MAALDNGLGVLQPLREVGGEGRGRRGVCLGRREVKGGLGESLSMHSVAAVDNNLIGDDNCRTPSI